MALITISPDFRTIQVPTGLILAVEGDQNVLTVNFTMARYYNGIDLSEYALKINYINAGGCGDIYLITDPEVQEEQILFNWTIGQNAAAYRGRLTFALEATKTDEAGTVTNELHTMPASIRVPATVDVCTGAAETALSDLLAQLIKIAGEAQESATEAARSATRAARSEEQAGEYADRAEASAYNAGLAKEQAQAARTGAEAAQTAAESARTAASNSSTRAANSATAAAGSAQEAADSRTEAAAYINELAGEKMNGDTVSYTAEAALPIEDLTIEIQGSQDLNGYRSPWVGGAGKNLFSNDYITTTSATNNGITFLYNDSAEEFNISGTATGTAINAYIIGSYGNTTPAFTLPAGTYTFSVTSGMGVVFYSYDGTTRTVFNCTENGFTYTLSADTPITALKPINRSSGVTYNETFKIQIEKGSTVTEWTPYENIAPINAYTGRTITQQGKNLINPLKIYTGIAYNAALGQVLNIAETAETMAQNDNIFTYQTTAAWQQRGWLADVEGMRGNLKFTALFNSTGTGGISVYLLDNAYTVLDKRVSNSVPNNVNINFDLSAYETAKYFVFGFTNRSTAATTLTLTSPQLEAGYTATEYEPYQHAETAVSWETEAGEVYKGRLNVSTGVLTVTESVAVFNGSAGETWYVSQAVGNYRFKTALINGQTHTGRQAVICNIGKYDAVSGGVGTVFKYGANELFYVPPQTITTVADFRTFLSSNNLVVAYPIEPITYQLTPQEVRNLIGRQKLSSDTGAIVNAWIRTGEETWLDARLESIRAKIEALHS